MWEGMQGPVNVAPYSTLGCLNSIETSDRKHAGKPCTIQQTATYCDDYYNYNIISEKGKRVCMSVRRRITSVQENARAAYVCYILTCNVCAVFDVVCKHVLVLGYCRGERVVLSCRTPFPSFFSFLAGSVVPKVSFLSFTLDAVCTKNICGITGIVCTCSTE